jgi:hypothetical protein
MATIRSEVCCDDRPALGGSEELSGRMVEACLSVAVVTVTVRSPEDRWPVSALEVRAAGACRSLAAGTVVGRRI